MRAIEVLELKWENCHSQYLHFENFGNNNQIYCSFDRYVYYKYNFVSDKTFNVNIYTRCFQIDISVYTFYPD